MKRSLSGDNITVLSFCTIKSGSPMVARQGQVMRAVASMEAMNLPRIYYIGKTWYAMQTIKESLGPPRDRTWNWKTAAQFMDRYWYMPEFWFYSGAPPFSVYGLFEYIEEQGWTTNMELPTISLLQSLYQNTLPRLTHGDLTHANTVIEHTQIYKFIDWQAYRHPYIPPHKDVDYGKMMQSLIGWDYESFARRTVDNSLQIRELLKECPMAWFWCAVHFMRIKVRAKEERLQAICDENIDYCSWLGEKKDAIA